MSDTHLHVLEKITLSYVAVEDRIAMNGQIKGGEAVTFWLTQRLCRELVNAFVGYLEKTTITPLAHGKSMLQSYFQQEAMMRKVSHPSVDPSTASIAPVLVKTFNLRSSVEVIAVQLPMPDGSVCALPLKPMEARQLLQILFVQFRKGDWPLDIWPQWIASQAVVGKPPDDAVH